MRSVISSAVVALLFASAARAAASEVTVKGELVEISCASTKGAEGKGPGHASCALSCARQGEPVGVLTRDAVYEITGDFTAGNNARLLDFLAKPVTVTGEITERDGKKLLNVRTIRAN
jgi:hypothetical protein